MSEINCGIHEPRFGGRCEVYGCNNSAYMVISNKDQIRGTSYNMCEDCLKELGSEISKVLGVEDSTQIPLESNLTPSNLEENISEDINIEKMNKEQLLEICKDRGIEVQSKIKKDELVELINAAK